jgi:hypothetical protein
MRRRALSILEHAACAAAGATHAVGSRARFLTLQAATKLSAVIDALRLENDLSDRAHSELKRRLYELERAGAELVHVEVETHATDAVDLAATKTAPANENVADMLPENVADPVPGDAAVIDPYGPLPNAEALGP